MMAKRMKTLELHYQMSQFLIFIFCEFMMSALHNSIPLFVFLCIHSVLNSLGYDVIAQAQSGTGKTATFSIAILEQVDVSFRGCQALVLAPTRELAQQVYTYLDEVVNY